MAPKGAIYNDFNNKDSEKDENFIFFTNQLG